MTACKVTNLTVNYEKTPALWEVSVTLPKGQLIAICGPNGAGKSTFMQGILGLLPSVSGQVDFFGETAIGYMPQSQSVDWDFPLTVFDLVLMGCYGRTRWFRTISHEEKEYARHCLARVGLQGLEKRQISQLSCGQRGRAFLARALAQKAQIYFMDEPFAGMDMASCQIIMNILRELKGERKTLIIVHHDLREVRQFFDYAVLLNRRLVAAGPVQEVLQESWLQKAYGKENLLLETVSQLSEATLRGLV